MSGLLKRCAEATSRGTVLIGLGVAFLVLGISGASGAYIGLGAAFLAIGAGRAFRKRGRPSSQ